MNTALYIVPEKEIEGFDSSVDGKSLSAAEAELALISQKLRVTSLMDFFSQSPAETIEFIEYHDEDAGDLEVPGENWFGADEGLKTTQALLSYLQEHPDAVGEAQAVLRDLRGFETVLQRLSDEDVRWHLATGM